MATKYTKENPYTLLALDEVPGGGTLSRYFNFAAEQVTTIFRERAELKETIKAYQSSGGNAVAASVALTSQMHVQKFNEFDSAAEIEFMHAELVRRGGKPPALNELPGKQKRPAGISKL